MSVVCITGASSGLGEHLALELARRGHDIGLIARRVPRLEALAQKIRDLGRRASIAPADVKEYQAVKKAVERVESELGPIQIMVANAGVDGHLHIKELDLDSIKHTFGVNVFGAIHAVKAVLPQMLERNEGQLVVVSSVASNRGLPKSATYSASKAAISIFWEGLRLDLANTNLHCTTIHPGFVATEMTAQNKHPMPFLMGPERAATIMATAIERKQRTCTYPWQMSLVERLMRVAPASLYDFILARVDKP